MTTPIPEGHQGIIPHLIVDGCADAIEFYKTAFGAEEMFRNPGPDGKKLMHATISIDALRELAWSWHSPPCSSASPRPTR